MALSKYNKDRPFLMVDLIRMPPKGAKTHMKNYGTEGQWNIGESISIEDAVKDRHLINCAVIIDVLKAKIVKNRLEQSDQEVMQYLVNKYKKEITDGIQVWMRKKGMNITPQQIDKIEQNINQPDIIALTLEEGDSPDISDKVAGTTVEEFIEEAEKKRKPRAKKTVDKPAEDATIENAEKPKRTRRKKAEPKGEATEKPKRSRKKKTDAETNSN